MYDFELILTQPVYLIMEDVNKDKNGPRVYRFTAKVMAKNNFLFRTGKIFVNHFWHTISDTFDQSPRQNSDFARKCWGLFHRWRVLYLSMYWNLTAGYAGSAGWPKHPADLPCLPLGDEQDVREEEEGQLVPLPAQDVLGSHLDTLSPTHKPAPVVKEFCLKLKL